jgi:prepilin-type processing-associated H-X9-DG protein
VFDSRIEARHNDTLNVTWGDAHAKNVKARLAQPAASCPTPDGQIAIFYRVQDTGPYQNRLDLWGIPFRRDDGSWGIR